jgi:hypothetical protein
MSTIIPSPGAPGAKVVTFTDEELEAQYIELPPDTIFVESLAQNPSYAPGMAYLPVQRLVDNDRTETHVYEIRVGMKEAKHLFGPIATREAGTAVTVFGSHLTSDGILYLCAFNLNSIIDFDLNNIPDTREGEPVYCNMVIPNIPSPNDMCVDNKDETVLYAVGGIFGQVCCCCGADFANSAYGQVFEIKVDRVANKATTKVICKKGLRTLAGVEAVGDEVWVAQLFDMVSINKTSQEKHVRWKGNDGKGNVWMADNVDTFDDNFLLCPAYSLASEFAVNNVLNRPFLMSAVLFVFQIQTAFMKGENLQEALIDPEVALSFSNTYIQEGIPPLPVRLLIMSPDGSKVCHYEIDLVKTRSENEPVTKVDFQSGKELGKRHFFNEQVTHAAHLKSENDKGYIACVNFEQPRLLLFRDTKFREALL